jgi:peptidoglycan-N-acetylglucosamine deacetylase
MLESLEARWSRLPGLARLPVPQAAALTFDDGPDPAGTPAVLDALDAADVRATFFVLGQQLVRHHPVAREIADRGHELALHGFEHVDHDQLAPQAARDEIERAVWAYEAILGASPRWFRPPFGRLADASLDACRDAGLEIVYWSASGEDWTTIGAAQIAANVSAHLTGGAIVLLHDSAAFADRADTAPTAAAIAAVAETARSRGIELAPLGEIAG